MNGRFTLVLLGYPIVLLALAVLLMTKPVEAQKSKPVFTPVTVSNGPLLFFVHGGNTLYVHDPEADTAPTVIWRTAESIPNVRIPAPKARVTRKLMVVSVDSRVYLLDLEAGQLRPLCSPADESTLSLAESSKVYFLRHEIPWYFWSYGLVAGPDGRTITTSYRKPRDYLYVLDTATEAPPRLLSETAIERVLDIDDEAFWVVTHGKPRRLCRIPRTGGLEVIIPLDEHWVTPDIHLFFSPDRRYLALTALHEAHDFHEERELVVVDLQKKRVCYSADCIKFWYSSMFDSATPQLTVTWIDEHLFKYAGVNLLDEVVINCVDGSRLDPEKIRKHGDSWTSEDWDKRRTRGEFDMKFGQLFYRGEKEPVVSVLDESGCQVSELEVSVAGRWAAAVVQPPHAAESAIRIVDGSKRTTSTLIPGWGHSLRWFPASRSKSPSAPK